VGNRRMKRRIRADKKRIDLKPVTFAHILAVRNAPIPVATTTRKKFPRRWLRNTTRIKDWSSPHYSPTKDSHPPPTPTRNRKDQMQRCSLHLTPNLALKPENASGLCRPAPAKPPPLWKSRLSALTWRVVETGMLALRC
jgi:hypothetical protein